MAIRALDWVSNDRRQHRERSACRSVAEMPAKEYGCGDVATLSRLLQAEPRVDADHVAPVADRVGGYIAVCRQFSVQILTEQQRQAFDAFDHLFRLRLSVVRRHAVGPKRIRAGLARARRHEIGSRHQPIQRGIGAEHVAKVLGAIPRNVGGARFVPHDPARRVEAGCIEDRRRRAVRDEQHIAWRELAARTNLRIGGIVRHRCDKRHAGAFVCESSLRPRRCRAGQCRDAASRGRPVPPRRGSRNADIELKGVGASETLSGGTRHRATANRPSEVSS